MAITLNHYHCEFLKRSAIAQEWREICRRQTTLLLPLCVCVCVCVCV